MDCLWLPDLSQLHVLGEFQTFGEARLEALRRFAKVNACFLCLPEHFKRPA